MIYKVYYQETFNEVPVRENTKSLFIEAKDEREVRTKLAHKNYNIEFVSPLSKAYIEYEEQKQNYKLENL